MRRLPVSAARHPSLNQTSPFLFPVQTPTLFFCTATALSTRRMAYHCFPPIMPRAYMLRHRTRQPRTLSLSRASHRLCSHSSLVIGPGPRPVWSPQHHCDPVCFYPAFLHIIAGQPSVALAAINTPAPNERRTSRPDNTFPFSHPRPNALDTSLLQLLYMALKVQSLGRDLAASMNPILVPHASFRRYSEPPNLFTRDKRRSVRAILPSPLLLLPWLLPYRMHPSAEVI